MRWTIRFAFGILMIGTSLQAQAPVPTQPVKQAKAEIPPMTEQQKADRLDLILTYWEREMAKVQNLSLNVTMTTIEDLRGSKEVYKGEAHILKPNKALLYIEDTSDPTHGRFKQFLSTGTNIYEYRSRDKIVVEHKFLKKQYDDNLLFAFLNGMKASDAKERFIMKYDHEEKPYAYLNIWPKRDSDKQEFVAARLVLVIDGEIDPEAFMIPRQIYYMTQSKEKVMYDIIKPHVNGKYPPNLFTFTKPKGWTVEPELNAPTNPFPNNAPRPNASNVKQ